MLALISWCVSLGAYAYIAPAGQRSPKGLLMGDAWTAVNADEYVLFYNPATLGRHSRDLTLSPFNPMVTGTNILDDMDKFEDFPDSPTGVADVIMDYPVHASAGIVPGFKLFNFGFNFIATEQVDLLLRNRIHPTLDVDYRSDRGFVMGVAIPIAGSRPGAKSVAGEMTTLGIGAKYIKRKGVLDSYALTGTDVLNCIDTEEEIDQISDCLGVVEGDAWGFDAGLEHIVRRGPNQLVFGLAALDITTTDFEVDNDEDGRQVAPNEDQLNVGMAWLHRSSILRTTFSLDVRGLTQEMELLERFRLGAEVGIPGISLLAGFNSGYYSYGAALDVGLLKLTAGFYSMEIGGAYRRTESKRFVIYVSLFDFSFDA